MQQEHLNTGDSYTGLYVGGTILTLMFLSGIYTFFAKTAVVAKSLAAGGSILLLVLLIPVWIKVFQNSKKQFTNKQ